MRKVTILPILIFQLLLAIPLAGAVWFALSLDARARQFPFGEFVLLLLTLALFLVLLTVVYRFYLAVCPVPVGPLPKDSPEERRYFVYLLFWLMFYIPLLRMSFIPAPMSGLVMRALGARIGDATYSSGIVFDAQFVTIGSNTQIGLDALLVPHSQVRGELAHYPIKIGSNVTIGGRSVIMAGVTIESGAVVGLCSLVTQGTHIRANEVWAGIPARLIKKAGEVES